MSSILTKRPACYTTASVPFIVFGGCSQQYISTSGSWTTYENVTTQANGIGNPCIIPVDGAATTLCACPSAVTNQGNCFVASSCAFSSSGCGNTTPTGWKAVRAKKSWCGAYPSGDTSCPCYTDSTKYLTTTRRVYGTMQQLVGVGQYDTYTLDWKRTYSIDRTSGKCNQVECVDTWTPAMGNLQNNPMPINYSFITMVVQCNTLPPSFVKTGGNYQYFSAPVDALNTWTASVSVGTGFGITFTSPSPSTDKLYNWVGAISFTNVLSDPYSISDVENDALGLVNSWNMADDTLLPWRTDSACTIVPVVARWEAGNVSPEQFIVGWNSCGAFVDPFPGDGRILGLPLPVGYGMLCPGSTNHPGYYNFTILENVPGMYGQWNSDYGVELPPWCTLWSDYEEQQSFPKGAFCFVDANDDLQLQKYCAVQDVVPSYNYPCRPCGADRFSYDQTNKFCISSTDPGTLTITLTLSPSDWSHDTLLAVMGASGFTDGVYKLDTIAGPTIVIQSPSTYFIPYGSFVAPDPGGNVAKILYPSSSAICGITKIVSATKTGSFVTMSIADPQTYLYPSDKVLFESSSGYVAPSDNVTVNSVMSSTTFTYAGNLPASTAQYVYSSGSYGFQCDTDSKGDFIFLQWGYDLCSTITTFNCNQACGNIKSPCAPPIMAILPSGATENFGNAQVMTLPLPTARNKQSYAIPIGNIPDPLWQAPKTCYGDPSAECLNPSPPAECNPQFFEARCSVPMLNNITMSLPPGRILGCWNQVLPLTCGIPALADCFTYDSSQEIGI